MTITSHYTIPENLADLTGHEAYDLVLSVEMWAYRSHADAFEVEGKITPRLAQDAYLLIRPYSDKSPLQAMPGDTMVITDRMENGRHELRLATMEEETELFHESRTAQPTLDSTEYELTWQSLNGTVGRAIITADHVTAGDQYLMFMLGGKIVHATKHSNVLEFNQPEVHYDNVKDGDGEPVQLKPSGMGNKFLP